MRKTDEEEEFSFNERPEVWFINAPSPPPPLPECFWNDWMLMTKTVLSVALGGAGERCSHCSPLLSSPQDGSLQCPTCKTIYGVKTGTQPPGKMEYHIIPHALPGHSDCKTIRIIYNIPPGVQVRLLVCERVVGNGGKALKKR